ncbi:class I SAM-dependent methyltransferase [Enterococcus sp. 669A]|uniref:Class I SAM-dependent methyltransferase n=1 Tax=Candidatus Enterococcus moelleringii TaxID=2815325 RepID=A0ABS3LDD2_9ENTE|nr:class I SAM-dependent methyltransferase [Enterococcus sp. 669A]MBO1307649.1 class I SAM-dependent methyltransferase [Enterococcus sp. 669A]
MTDENLQELEEFWDEFAPEYESIQQESNFPIAEAVKQFLLEKNILPSATFLDLAGGSGRYLTSFQDVITDYTFVDLSKEMLAIAQTKQQNQNVQFIHQDQETFFQRNSQTFDVVFTAMNPALITKDDLLNFTNQSHGWCLILRLVQQTDSLFSPYEPANEEPNLMESYQQFLAESGTSFNTRDFVFTSTEEITREFFEAYFEDDYSSQQLKQMADKVFGQNEPHTNQQTIRYQLLYYPAPKNPVP